YKTEKVWLNALYARAFDIARSLLPLGTTTLLSWTTSLRAARDHIRRLKHHPLPEVREVAAKIFQKLVEKYPHSFKATDIDVTASPADVYMAKFGARDRVVSASEVISRLGITEAELDAIRGGALLARPGTVDLEALKQNEAALLAERPKTAPLPWRIESYGRYNLAFLLDFGSFRDLQRHRNGVCQVPLIDGRFGFHPWYLEQMEDNMPAPEFSKLKASIDAQFAAIAGLAKEGVPVSPALRQYYFPMGTQALVHASYSVPEVVYIGELRSAKTVHPSLRPVAQKLLALLERDLPGMALYGDRDEDSWSAKRGEQTIVSKKA
ncbi:MAG: FAD-dependent thymidylate synthase, partial [Alphaproteobacteria bacterium]|nr:FAD-dependent thymidylate synthase [Alphaproteobacteria bacterium]